MGERGESGSSTVVFLDRRVQDQGCINSSVIRPVLSLISKQVKLAFAWAGHGCGEDMSLGLES